MCPACPPASLGISSIFVCWLCCVSVRPRRHLLSFARVHHLVSLTDGVSVLVGTVDR